MKFFEFSSNLKTVPRQGWIDKLSHPNPESVADHTFSMAIIGMILADSNSYNFEKIMKMILIHDLAESITGDFTPEQKTREEKQILENKAFEKILTCLPENIKIQYQNLWEEYQRNDSEDAKIVHQIDKFEMALQAKIYSKTNPQFNVDAFFESAKKEINNPELLKIFDELKLMK